MRLLPLNAPLPNPNEIGVDWCEKGDDEAEYGYSSTSFLAAWFMALRAVSRVGRGIKDRTVGFREGCVESKEVRMGSRD